MADIVKTQGESVPSNMKSRWVDMHDGTHALQRSVVVVGPLDVDLVAMPANTIVTGTIDANGEVVAVALPPGCSSVALQILGMPAASQINFEGSVDAVPTWLPVTASNGTATINATAGDGIFVLPGGGYRAIRARSVAWGAGAANLTFLASTGVTASILTGALPAGENHIGEVGGNSGPIRTTFTRPNDILAYIAKDALNSSVGAPVIITFANVGRKVGGTGYITKVRLMTSQSTNTARYRLHLYSVAPAALADNVPFTLLIANWANRIGYVDLDAMGTEGAGSDCAISQNTDIRLQFACAAADRNLYGQFETLDIFTPAANQVYNIELGVEAN